MSSGSEAQKAIDSLNGTQLDGRTLTVNEAKPMAKRDNFGGGGGNLVVVVAAAIAMAAVAVDATAGKFFVTALTAKKGNRSGCPFFVISQEISPGEFFMERFFATCPRGLELLLAEELRQLKAEKIHAVGGGVQFGGDFFLCYRVNLESRIASRVLWQVAAGDYRSEEDIYRTAYALRWTHWFDPARAPFASMSPRPRVRLRASISSR